MGNSRWLQSERQTQILCNHWLPNKLAKTSFPWGHFSPCQRISLKAFSKKFARRLNPPLCQLCRHLQHHNRLPNRLLRLPRPLLSAKRIQELNVNQLMVCASSGRAGTRNVGRRSTDGERVIAWRKTNAFGTRRCPLQRVGNGVSAE